MRKAIPILFVVVLFGGCGSTPLINQWDAGQTAVNTAEETYSDLYEAGFIDAAQMKEFYQWNELARLSLDRMREYVRQADTKSFKAARGEYKAAIRQIKTNLRKVKRGGK